MLRLIPVLGGLVVGCVTALVAAPIPKGDPLPPPTAEQVRASRNNLKQIGLAGHNYLDVNAQLVGDITDNNGKPILSWRVQYLPYLEEEALYKQFKLDEPWDSDHNKKLIAKMPKVYAPIRVKAKPGETFYRGFTGPGSMFEAKLKLTLPGITDGTSNTVWVVEAGEPAIWTKPDDLPFDPKKSLPKLGGLFDGDFNVLSVDGAVHHVRKGFDQDTFKKLITRSGGEVTGFDMLAK